MPRAISTWNGAWTRTSSSTAGSSLPGPGPQMGRAPQMRPGPQMAESGHWLAGRVTVVTGASRGIGAATAQAVAAAGAHVVLAARDGEALGAVAERIHHAGGDATPVRADVSSAGDVARLFAAAEAAGTVAALVCAAAVLEVARFDDTTPELWAETLGVNLTGSFLCCRAAFTAMRQAGEGRIVTLGSLSGVYGTEKFPGLAAYNVSKIGRAC